MHRLRNRIISHGDPIVATRVNSQITFCPFSHMLALYQREFPKYDRQLKRICDVIFCMSNRLSVIDVGANIGDTVINIGNKKASFLLIEGESQYMELIRKNLKRYNYSIENTFLSDYPDNVSYSCKTFNGTGHLEKSTGESNRMDTLDHVIESKYGNLSFDILIVDTDGFDFKVLRGSQLLLKNQSPLIYFEWDKNFLKFQDEDYMSIFPLLKSLDYNNLLIFNNFGDFIRSIASDDLIGLQELSDRVDGKSVFYYDILAIPSKWSVTEDMIIKAVR